MLSYLTHKLRTPELNGSSAFHTKTDDDHDSGTESDDESAEIQELQKYMEHSIQLEDGSGQHSPSGRRKVVLCQHATRFRQTQQQQQTQQDAQQQQQPNNKPMERRRQPPHLHPHNHHQQAVSGPAVVTALLSATVSTGGRGPSVGAECGGGGSPALLDSALPSDSDPNLEQHSSEEELEVINNRAGSAEKRKWSQANQRRARGARASLRRSRSDGAAGDSSSDEEEEYDAASVAGDAALAVNGALSNGAAGRSDDDDEEEDDDDDEDDAEVRDLTWSSGGGGRCEAANGVHSSNNSSCNSQRSSSSSATVVPPAPVEFRASPPLHVHRPYNGSPPPKVFHAAAPVGGGGLGPTTLTLSASAHIPAFEVCAVSPRKRHRQDRGGGGTAFGVFSLVDGGPVQRPCLDFEKMQQIRVKLL